VFVWHAFVFLIDLAGYLPYVLSLIVRASENFGVYSSGNYFSSLNEEKISQNRDFKISFTFGNHVNI
jgi:hypothetical protein